MPASPDFRGESPSLINSADPALSAPTRTEGPASIPCSPYRALQRARYLRPASQRPKSAIVPIAADALRISPVPAQVGTRAHRDGTNGGNGNESAKRHTGNDRAVIGTPHPRPSKPIGSASPARRTAPYRCSSPTRLTVPTRIGADAGIYARARTHVAGPPRFIGVLDRCG